MNQHPDDDAVKKEMSARIEQNLTPDEQQILNAYLVGHLSTIVSQQVFELALLSAQKHILEKRRDALENENEKLIKQLSGKPS